MNLIEIRNKFPNELSCPRVDNMEARAMEEKARGVFLGRFGDKMKEFEN
jgi:hypothetical protein